MTRRDILWMAVAFSLFCSATATVHAQGAASAASTDDAGIANADQPAQPAPEARAQRLHQEGAAALLDARFATARDFFQEAMELAPNGGSAYNLALALRGTGESLGAIATFERILDGEFGPVSDARRVDIERWIIEERGALSVIELSLAGAESAELRIDGSDYGSVERGSPRRLDLDAGRRALSLRAAGYETREEVVFAERATAASLTLTLTPIDEPRSIFERPAFWVVAGALVLAGVTAGIVIALGPYEESPTSHEPFGVATALRWGD